MAAAGKVSFRLWGAGGGGGSDPLSRLTGYAGSGGFTDGILTVAAGDVIKLEVGGGGQKGVAAVNALGGWPDGGRGGVGSVNTYSAGGGGGSTRIYLNDVLVSVAGGGGGGCYGTGGPGGGPTGGSGFSTTLVGAPGGTQSAGGSSSANTGSATTNGTSLAGGNSLLNDQYTGGGGGGGYYGGAAGSNSGSNTYRGGGGGSGYLHASVVQPARNLIGQWRYPAVTAGAPAGVGEGGRTASSYADNLHTVGGDGYAALELFEPVTLPTSPTTLTFSGKRKVYVATTAQTLTGHLWGGAGAGGTYISGGQANRKGGAGGYVAFSAQVVPGDVIRFEVGEGGKPSAYDTTLPTTSQPVAGGVGGWPDGGIGGRSTTTHIGFGGGGGSTRLYINDVLAAVAGGGGAATGFYYGGNGGGASGLASTDTASGGGGTQSAGGTTGTGITLMGGASLRGGYGVVDQTVPAATAGGGGGGGYYGGGSNMGAGGSHGSGGGGSGYVNTALIQGAMQVGLNNTGAPFNVAGVRGSGVAEGGTGVGANYSTTTAGGNGQATFSLGAPPELPTNTPTTVAYSGVFTEYTASSAGDLTFKLWGGGGGGGSFHSGMADTNPPGGAGGLTTGRLVVAVGDIIKIEVSQGGEQSTTTMGRGGNGGWPDGGKGGYANSTNTGACFGGGGGSTRLYLNNVLMAVVGGGGGDGWSQPYGGPGGGLTGGTEGSGAAGLGGTQSAGGAFGGGNLQGGDSRVPRDFTGGGGGGGWYGGGSSRGLYGPGGGGSSWVHASVLDSALLQGVQGTPPVDSDRPSGVALGGLGQNYTNGKTPTKGGDGAALITLTPSPNGNASGALPTVTVTPPTATASLNPTMPEPGVTTVVPYTGQPVSYVATAATQLDFEIWGGGGGGVGTVGSGGGGGYTTYSLTLSAGDRVTIQTASGGTSGVNASDSPVVLPGGYPDGGTGRPGGSTLPNNGGGGSSRVFVNDVLVAVAGGGGGGFWSTGGNAFAGQGGPGGGAAGDSGKYIGGSGNAASGGGGSQSAGGAGGGSVTARNGGYLLGGDGGPSGPGGGGGYYGGGGGLAGGGGSGYFSTAYAGYLTGSTTMGAGSSPAGTGSSNYLAGIGTGSGGTIPGGAGRIVFINNTPTPGNASGDVGTVTVTAPSGGVEAYFPSPRDIGTVSLSVGDGIAGIPAFVNQPLPTVVVNVPSADPRAQAIVTIPINNNTSVLLTGPANVPFEIPGTAEGEIATIVVAPALAEGQVPNEASGDIGTITVTTVDGTAESNFNGNAVGAIGTITLTEVKTDVVPVALLSTIDVTAPTGVPHGAVLVTDDLSTVTITPPEGVGAVSVVATGETPLVYVTPPEAAVITDDSNVYATLGVVRMTPPQAELLIISDDNFIVRDLPSPVVITDVPLAEAGADVTGAVNFIVPAANPGNPFPEERYMFRIFATPPEAAVEVPAEVVAPNDWIVIVAAPVGVTDLSANVNVAMPNPIVINGADAEVSLDITVPLSDNDIILTAPEATVDYSNGFDLPTVIVLPPEGMPSISASASGEIGAITLEAPRFHYIPPVVIVAPEGEAVGYASASVEAPMPPSIIVTNIEGGSQSSATVSLPIPQVFVFPPEPFVVASVTTTGAIGTIVVTPPAGVTLVPASASGGIGTIDVIAAEGFAGVAAGASGDIGSILVTPPEPDALTGAANTTGAIGTIVVTPPLAQGQVPGDAVGDTLPPILLAAPEGFVTTGAIDAIGDIGTITLTPPEADAGGQGQGAGDLGTILVTPPRFTHIPQVTVLPPEALAGVAADASGDLITITINPPEATATAAALVVANDPLIVTLTPPVAAPVAGVDLVTAQEITVLVIPPQATVYKEANVVVGFPTIFVYAPAATAMSMTEFDTIKVVPPDAYVDVPLPEGKARIRYKRTVVRGRAPASLFPREINLNETDGVLYARNAAGDVLGTPLGQLTGGGLPPVAVADGKVLSANGVWTDPAPIYTTPVRNAPPAGERIALADGVTALTTFTPTVGALYTRPFFVARAIDIAALSVEVVSAAAAASAQLAIIGWSLSGAPGATLASGAVSASTTGVKQAAGTAVTLTPGWYAATFQVTGAAGAAFRAATAPATLAPDLTAVTATPACVMADLEA